MRLLRRFPITVMTMVLISIVGVCAAGRSVKLLLVAFALTALSWYVTEGPRGRVLPRWVANLLVIAAALSLVVDLRFSPNDLAGVLGRFCVWLAIIKLYQRRTARDHAQLMALSLLLIIVGCLRTQELFFGIVLVLYAVTGLYALLLYQLYAAREGVIIAHRTAEAADGEAPPAPTTGRHSALHFRLLAIGIAVAGLSLSVALFVIFPRNVGHGLFTTALRGHGGATRAGYFCDFDRNFAFGHASDEAKRAYVTLYRATDAALNAARPGITCSRLYGLMGRVIEQAGGSVGRFGHGLGMQLTEPPSIIDFDDTVLQAGMVITLEPSMVVCPGKVMVHEENIVIRDGAPELLSQRAPPELPIL